MPPPPNVFLIHKVTNQMEAAEILRVPHSTNLERDWVNHFGKVGWWNIKDGATNTNFFAPVLFVISNLLYSLSDGSCRR